MNNRAGCDLARSPHDSVTESDAKTGRSGAIRTVLRAADGVRIEALHEPYAGGDGVSGRSRRAPGVIVLAHGFTGSLDRPALRRAATAFTEHAAVVTFSFRGHGGSGGASTVGDREVLDLAAAVAWARSLGYARVATVGFSMGGSVVLRHAALHGQAATGHGKSPEIPSAHGGRAGAHLDVRPLEGGPATTDAVVAVSAPARWYYNGTAPMRRLHWLVQRRLGRLVGRYGLRTRIHPHDWDPVPLSPVAAAPLIAPTPLLVVHGDQDPYFPFDHPLSLVEAADPASTELWTVRGFGHAENAAEMPLLHRIGDWARARIEAAPTADAADEADGTDRTDGTDGTDEAAGQDAGGAADARAATARRHHGTRNADG